ncbi:AraC-like DNA-binding protein [Streptomyces sp. Ag109_O5-1]|nr:AraC-like DNA-binding protein [Streptomyces sp. Ag109_O5-1]
MNGAKVEAAAAVGAYSFDTTASAGAYDTLLAKWDSQIGNAFRQPAYTRDTTDDFRVKGHAARVLDAAIIDVDSASAIQTAGTPDGREEQVRLYLVRRGAWTLGEVPDRGEHTVASGEFLLRHIGRPSSFRVAPHTTAKIVVLPAATCGSLLSYRSIVGPADTAEVRLLTAHAQTVHDTVTGLSPAGVQAAHSTLIELAKAVVMRKFDDVEPLLALSLAQAAKSLTDSHLTDPELSPAMLAGKLNTSVRTLQRAFVASGESVATYIRNRRLEEARLALTAWSRRLTVSELAAHWQFADSSHFIRAFKKRYGQTPAEYARSTRPGPRGDQEFDTS